MPHMLYKELVSIDGKDKMMYSKWYFVVCHMFLYYGKDMWNKVLQLKLQTSEGFLVPIQGWIYIWDMHCQYSNNVVFEECFVQVVLRNIGYLSNKLFEGVMKYLRPKDKWPEIGMNQNYGA